MLQLPPQLTHTTASACLLDLGAALPAEPAGVVVSASGLGRFDSAALAVLLSLRRQALGLGKTFAVTCLPQRLADLARLYGVAELLPDHVGSAALK